MAITDKIQEKLNQKRWRAYREVFNIDDLHANEVLSDMCSAHHVFDAGFDSDPLELARMAGERNVVLRILTILKLKPEDIISLVKEDKDDS
ncbi:hypothetical protein KAR91_63135 [Candidatus Pacearchaeota archaeon]|nr:hypothetical protein [Candidatus Pacearchaeota archaeon]